MPVRRAEIKFPMAGQSEQLSFSEQPPGTSPDMLNMRPLDYQTRRLRGFSRAGTSKYITAAVSGVNFVRDIGWVVGDDSQITYTQADGSATGTKAINMATEGGWSVTIAPSISWYRPTVDLRGNFYTLRGDSEYSFLKYNAQGNKVTDVSVPASSDLRAMAVDDTEAVYVGVSTGGVQEDGKLYKYSLNPDAESYFLTYSGNMSLESGSKAIAYISCLYIFENTLYIGLYDEANAEYEIQVYYHIASIPILPFQADVSFTCQYAPLGIAVNSYGEIIVVSSEPSAVTATSGLLGYEVDEQAMEKFAPDGSAIWKIDTADTTTVLGGMGQAVAVDSSDDIFTSGSGNDDGGGSDLYWLHKWDDTGTADPTISWSKKGVVGQEPQFATLEESSPYRDIAVDEADNVYAAYTRYNGAGVGTGSSVYAYQGDGTQIFQYSSRVSVSGATLPVEHWVTVGVALPPSRPDYGEDSVDTQEFMFIASRQYSSGSANVGGFGRARTVTTAISEGSQRTTKVVVVSGGNVKVGNGTSSWDDPTIGTSVDLDSSGEYTWGVTMFGKRYWTDGNSYAVYDLATDTVEEWAAERGEVPPRCKVIGAWRGRMVLGRSADDGHRWYMSKVGDPLNWNYFPVVPASTDAVEGVNSDVGKIPDLINTFVPWSDDLAIWGCDNSIWRMTGDPLAGGQIDNLTQVVGMAYGRCWDRDPQGNVIFMSTQGDVYVLEPMSGRLTNLSEKDVNKVLATIDQTTRFVRLIWSEEEDGFYVFSVPRVTGGTAEEHYFFSRRTQGWFPVKYGGTAPAGQPTSFYTLDGDKPADRVLLIGCEDGIVRKYDESVSQDDGNGFTSEVLLGPYGVPDSGKSLRLVSWQITLADKKGPVTYELYASDRADNKGSVRDSGDLMPGKNSVQFSRVRGEYFWILLRSKGNLPWGYESGWLKFATAGRQRVMTP